jgi:hypothetical protein
MTNSKTQGVVLFAFGRHTYYWAMYNIALTIKHHSPSTQIAAFVGSKSDAGKFCGDLHTVVDSITEIERDDIYTGKSFDPGKLKVNIYKYLPFDHNLYLDVDAIALKPIDDLFVQLSALGKSYASHTVGYHTIDKGRAIESMQWAWADDIWNQYELPDTAILPAINSSLQFIVKCNEAELLYKTARYLYMQNPIPLKSLRMKWGGGQPDELYMNIAMAMLNIDPKCSEIGNDGAELGHIHFAAKRGLTFSEVIDRYYFQSYYGGVGFTARFYVNWIDSILKNLQKSRGRGHIYTIDRILQYKHADNK